LVKRISTSSSNIYEGFKRIRASRGDEDLAHIILGVAKISAKNRLTIPKEVLTKYGFKKGDLILFVEEEGKLVVKKGLMTRIG